MLRSGVVLVALSQTKPSLGYPEQITKSIFFTVYMWTWRRLDAVVSFGGTIFPQ